MAGDESKASALFLRRSPLKIPEMTVAGAEARATLNYEEIRGIASFLTPPRETPLKEPMSKEKIREVNPPPFSRPLIVSAVPSEGLDMTLSPNASERAALARENGLLAVHELEAKLRVARSGADGLEVAGRLHARIRQTCVVTLEEFDAVIDEPVRMRFAPQGQSAPKTRPSDEKATFVELDDEAPDPLIGGVVDLGAVASEFLTLGLDPYPRRPGASFEAPAQPGGGDSPFSALSQQAKGRSGDGS